MTKCAGSKRCTNDVPSGRKQCEDHLLLDKLKHQIMRLKKTLKGLEAHRGRTRGDSKANDISEVQFTLRVKKAEREEVKERLEPKEPMPSTGPDVPDEPAEPAESDVPDEPEPDATPKFEHTFETEEAAEDYCRFGTCGDLQVSSAFPMYGSRTHQGSTGRANEYKCRDCQHGGDHTPVTRVRHGRTVYEFGTHDHQPQVNKDARRRWTNAQNTYLDERINRQQAAALWLEMRQHWADVAIDEVRRYINNQSRGVRERSPDDLKQWVESEKKQDEWTSKGIIVRFKGDADSWAVLVTHKGLIKDVHPDNVMTLDGNPSHTAVRGKITKGTMLTLGTTSLFA